MRERGWAQGSREGENDSEERQNLFSSVSVSINPCLHLQPAFCSRSAHLKCPVTCPTETLGLK